MKEKKLKEEEKKMNKNHIFLMVLPGFSINGYVYLRLCESWNIAASMFTTTFTTKYYAHSRPPQKFVRRGFMSQREQV
jgi:hypothetical protein